MKDLTLESLAGRVEALQIAGAGIVQDRPAKAWRKSVGMFQDSELLRAVDDECQRLREAEREAEREAARRGKSPEGSGSIRTTQLISNTRWIGEPPLLGANRSAGGYRPGPCALLRPGKSDGRPKPAGSASPVKTPVTAATHASAGSTVTDAVPR